MRVNSLPRLVLVCLSFLLVTSGNTQAQKNVYQYLEKHRQTAIVLMKKTGIPASIILGVSMVESAVGQSRNCKLLNNYFGVKGKNNLPKGKGAPQSAYKQYPNAKESFKDFTRIVQKKKYYPTLKGNKDYGLWLKEMNKSGYAAAKGKWIADVSSMIKKYKLDDIDKDLLLFDDNDYNQIWGVDSISLELME